MVLFAVSLAAAHEGTTAKLLRAIKRLGRQGSLSRTVGFRPLLTGSFPVGGSVVFVLTSFGLE